LFKFSYAKKYKIHIMARNFTLEICRVKIKCKCNKTLYIALPLHL
jgi:hypothetical protein